MSASGMLIDGWRCEDMWPGTDWNLREAKARNVCIQATADGLDIREECSGYMGASGSVGIPANVLVWLMGAVR